jgi:MerR family transcriptional regulator, light-induced transcriptional regulator
MGNYSIKELEQLSGIKAHTIRIWEKRHRLIAPQRTHTNIRFYSDYDLKKIINVSTLNSNGLKISVIAKMSEEELTRKVMEISNATNKATIYIDQLVTSMLELDEEKFETDLQTLEQKFGFETMITDVVYPFLEKIGLLWQTGNITPAHEHFISNLIRQRVIVATASLPIVKKGTVRAVLFLPENEFHEIGLLFYHYIARKQGFKTYYLGQAVPHQDLKSVCEVHRPHLLITSMTSSPTRDKLNDYLQKLSTDFPSSKILASGAVLRRSSFKFPSNLKFFENAVELRELLRAMK